MHTADIIIVGAGAAGLMAAHQLSKAGKKVIVLEARGRTGGRILTITDTTFTHVVDAGAEFIHGNLQVTFDVLKEAGISAKETGGKTWIYKRGTLKQEEEMIEDWDVLMSRVKKVESDITLADFLKNYLPEPEFEELRESVKSFAEGYDAADTTRTSTLAMKAEWSNQDQWDQHRSEGGYIKLINYLAEQCSSAATEIKLSSVVKEVRWRKDDVKAVTADGETYSAGKLVITVPVGVLQASASAPAAMSFQPEIPAVTAAIKQLGYGAAIKMILEFDHPFWNERRDSKGYRVKEMGYLFTDAFIPTWWTQFPKPSAVLTGWLAGPKAGALKEAGDDTILELAIETLSEIFSAEKVVLKKMLTGYRILNWTADPFSLGCYSYNTVESQEAKKRLREPVENTLYFAGEALGDGYDCGTVEVALASGKEVAGLILTAENMTTPG
jgi:monoamine oxidase